jgi:hypothetical protein
MRRLATAREPIFPGFKYSGTPVSMSGLLREVLGIIQVTNERGAFDRIRAPTISMRTTAIHGKPPSIVN